MKAKSIKSMMSTLTKLGVHVCGTTDEFYGCKNDNNGIWIAADSNPEVFNYYSEHWMVIIQIIFPALKDVV